MMKVFGYPNGSPVNDQGLVELKEISLVVNPEALREFAKFLLNEADEMERMGRCTSSDLI